MIGAAFVHMMASGRNGTIYIGVTTDPARRAWEHREGVGSDFTRRYRCTRLVWWEAHDSLEAIRLRERQMKEWKRVWKLREIEGVNPDWADLSSLLA